jgi:CHAD domain-containing protein
VKQSSPAANFIHHALHQECESARGRWSQALGVAQKDQVEGVRGYRRAVKKIRCALLLTAGGLCAHKRQALDQRWALLARRLGTFRDMDAREKKLKEIIAGVPAIHQEAACLVWNMASGAAVDAISGAKSNAAVDAMSGSNRLEVLQGMASDMEHLICDTEKIKFPHLTPEMVAGSIEHLWNRARARADKSWVGRDDAWLHSLRKRVQRTHIAFRLVRAQSGERGVQLEKRFDEAAKAMGELRDISMIRLIQMNHMMLPANNQAVEWARHSLALEFLHAHIAQKERQAATHARQLIEKAFKPTIEKTLRHIALHIHAL